MTLSKVKRAEAYQRVADAIAANQAAKAARASHLTALDKVGRNGPLTLSWNVPGLGKMSVSFEPGKLKLDKSETQFERDEYFAEQREKRAEAAKAKREARDEAREKQKAEAKARPSKSDGTRREACRLASARQQARRRPSRQ